MLARLYGWGYWQVEALPADYVDELLIALEIEREADDRRREVIEQQQAKAAKITGMRTANLNILRKQGLRPA